MTKDVLTSFRGSLRYVIAKCRHKKTGVIQVDGEVGGWVCERAKQGEG